MACTPIITGDRFLARTLVHVDCQAQLIGSYGYQALGEPGSIAATVMTGLLTVFVALFGLRLMFGRVGHPSDVVLDVLKVGIVLVLAFSWPAFRTVIYDVTLQGPAEISSAIQSASQGSPALPMAERLQTTDNAIVDLTSLGTGRNTGMLIDSEAPGGTFESSALQDENSFGWARLAFLASVIGGLTFVRIAAGVLLAIAPLAAGLLLFPQTRGLFAGWLKGLVFALLGSVGISIMLLVELAVIEPWLADALRVRSLGYATPAAPTELFAITLSFALAHFAFLALLARVAFHRGWRATPPVPLWMSRPSHSEAARSLRTERVHEVGSNAARISTSVETSIERETRWRERTSFRSIDAVGTTSYQTNPTIEASVARLGSSYRRGATRHSRASIRRDNLS